MRKGVIIPSNAGLVITTAAVTGDLLHTLSAGRKARIRKVMWYNNTGALATIVLGTTDNAAPAAFVPLFPTIACVNGQHDMLVAAEIPDVIFAVDRRPGATGQTGDIYVVSSVAGILVRLTVEEG